MLMANYMDDPEFWRDQAFRFEASGDLVVAAYFWQATILATKRQAAALGRIPDLKWLTGRLLRARSVADLVSSNQRCSSFH